MKIEGRTFKKQGDKKASEFLNELLAEEGKKIKLIMPFEANGTFEKIPFQPDGVTPVIVNKPSFEAKGKVILEDEGDKEFKDPINPKVEKEIVVKKVKKTKTIKKKK